MGECLLGPLPLSFVVLVDVPEPDCPSSLKVSGAALAFLGVSGAIEVGPESDPGAGVKIGAEEVCVSFTVDVFGVCLSLLFADFSTTTDTLLRVRPDPEPLTSIGSSSADIGGRSEVFFLFRPHLLGAGSGLGLLRS